VNVAVARLRIVAALTLRYHRCASSSDSSRRPATVPISTRWGSTKGPSARDRTGRTILLIGVQAAGTATEYDTIPYFTTERANRPPCKVHHYRRHDEGDTYYGCCLDVNQMDNLLIPMPPIPTGATG